MMFQDTDGYTIKELGENAIELIYNNHDLEVEESLLSLIPKKIAMKKATSETAIELCVEIEPLLRRKVKAFVRAMFLGANEDDLLVALDNPPLDFLTEKQIRLRKEVLFFLYLIHALCDRTETPHNLNCCFD